MACMEEDSSDRRDNVATCVVNHVAIKLFSVETVGRLTRDVASLFAIIIGLIRDLRI